MTKKKEVTQYFRIRTNEDNSEWGLTEEYSLYSYGDVWSGTLCVGAGGVPSEPKLMIGGEFVPMAERESFDGVSVEKYLKAKKPVYSVLGSGLIVKVFAHVVRKPGGGREVLGKGFSVWYPQGVKPLGAGTGFSEMVCVKAEDLPDVVGESLDSLVDLFAETAGDRAAWLRGRFEENWKERVAA